MSAHQDKRRGANHSEMGAIVEVAGDQRPAGPGVGGAKPVDGRCRIGYEPLLVDVGVPEDEVEHHLLRRQAAREEVQRAVVSDDLEILHRPLGGELGGRGARRYDRGHRELVEG